MNFHKTIGYLAALLLMVGLGVPDSFAQKLTLTIAPPTISDNAETATVAVTVTVTLAAAPANEVTVSVPVRVTMPSNAAIYTGRPTVDFDVMVIGDGSNAQGIDGSNLIITGIKQDKDDVDEEISVEASTTRQGFGDADPVVLTITDIDVVVAKQNAGDSATGFRVEIVEPEEDWLGIDDLVRVKVIRREGPSLQWGAFRTITVNLYDEDDNHATTGTREASATSFYSMAISNDINNNQLSSLFLEDVRRDTLESGADEDASKAYYTRRSQSGHYDTLEFRVPIAERDVESQPADLSKVYAVVIFASDGTVNYHNGDVTGLESRDTETSIFPPNPSIYPDKVGNGVLAKIDRVLPLGNVITALEVPKAITINNGAGIGKKIEITATVDGVFIDSNVRLEILATAVKTVPNADGVTVTVVDANQPLVGFSKDIGAVDVLNSGGELTHTITVKANQFKRKYTADHPTDDKKKEGGTFEDDHMRVRVRASVTDKADNAANQYADGALGDDVAVNGLSRVFTLDSKPPVFESMYPDSSHKRYTAQDIHLYAFLGDTNDEQPLNPLEFTVDEVLSGETFIIIGADSLITSGSDVQVDLGMLKQRKGTKDGDEVIIATDDANHVGNKKVYNAGKAANLKIGVRDRVGNLATASPKKGDSGNAGTAIFDNKAPEVQRLFPNNDDLKDSGNKIGGPEQTQNPVFRITEAVDSMLVRYEGDDILDIAGSAAQRSTVDQNIRFSFLGDNALQEGQVYSLEVYVKDLAGYVGTSGLQTDLTFDNALVNPSADEFTLVTTTSDGKNEDKNSVIAGQALILSVTAMDTKLKRPAVTYSKDGVQVSTTDSDGNLVSGVSYSGTGVTDSGDGTATLDGDTWTAGVFDGIEMDPTQAGSFTVSVRDMNEDGVVNIMVEAEITVDAADFAGFEMTAWETGVVGAAQTVWGDFTLRVVPADEFGNPSVKVFASDPGNVVDSLSLRDSEVAKANTKHFVYSDGIDVTFRSNPALEDLPSLFEWPILPEGTTFEITAPDNRRFVDIQARVVNESLKEDDERSEDIRSTQRIAIGEPVEISITLWVPGTEGDQAGNDVTIPAGGSVTVTARAEGLNEGDMVTFTVVDGEAQDAVAADADGYAGQPIELSGSGTVSVTATSGQYSESLEITHTEQEGRVKYVDDNGDPVYLIGKSSGTVGVDDFLALVAAFGSSEGDDNYNPQADVNDDGSVGVDDILVFVGSFGKTAAVSGKPIVLLPGINENAEFSLSLGSDGVVAGELMAVDVSLANVEALIGYGFALNYDADKFEFVSVASADEDLLTSTGGETLFHHVVADGQISVATGMYNGTAVSGGGDIVRFVFRVLYEFEDNARFEIADGLVFDPSQLQNPAVVAGVLELQSTPREFALHQNFPNPFNPDTTIKYDLAESADVTLQIYNVLGQVVRTLVASEAQNAGRYQIRWNGMDDRGVSVSSGIYFYRISAGEFQNVRKLMLLK